MNKCSGDGSCLIRENEKSYKKDINIECEHNCKPVKCPNFIICGESAVPLYYLQCHNGLCINCDMMFGSWTSKNYKKTGKGILNFYENVECPICLETKRGVDQPNCNHTLCIDCFKRCYYGCYDNEPHFPYPHIENEYYADPDNQKWTKDYPLIAKYNKDLDEWDNQRELQYEKKDHLHKCPLCRK